MKPHPDLFDGERRRSTEEILTGAMEHKPREVFACFSSGDDSLAATHWIMNNVPGAKVFNANTGIGIQRSLDHMRETCHRQGWPLVEIRAKEDCGSDYEAIVREHGFPGPAAHRFMYSLLKERCVDKLIREHKKHWRDRVVLGTGIRYDESIRRMGYSEDAVRRDGATVWMNHIYWWSDEDRDAYIKRHGLARNPVKQVIGISGECLCGAFAHKGEKSLVRLVEPETAARLERLEREVRAAGHDWGWEDRPPKEPEPIAPDLRQAAFVFCRGCEKAA